VRTIDMGKEPPHIIRAAAQNDLRHVACIVAKIDATTDPRTYVENLIAEMRRKTIHA
jgi:hypothetical protein